MCIIGLRVIMSLHIIKHIYCLATLMRYHLNHLHKKISDCLCNYGEIYSLVFAVICNTGIYRKGEHCQYSVSVNHRKLQLLT